MRLFGISNFDSSSLMARDYSASGFRSMPKRATTLDNQDLRSCGQLEAYRACFIRTWWAKNGKYEYCCLVSTISFGKYLRPIGCDLIYPTPLPRRFGALWRLKSVKAGNFSKILLLLKLWQYSYLPFFAHWVSSGASRSSLKQLGMGRSPIISCIWMAQQKVAVE